MDRIKSFELGPMSVSVREVLEGFDDHVTVDLPHFHVTMVDVSYSLASVEAFREQVVALVAGASDAAVLDLSYSEGAYGLIARLVPTEGDAFSVTATITPDFADASTRWKESVTYSVAFDVGRSVVESAVQQMHTRLE